MKPGDIGIFLMSWGLGMIAASGAGIYFKGDGPIWAAWMFISGLVGLAALSGRWTR